MPSPLMAGPKTASCAEQLGSGWANKNTVEVMRKVPPPLFFRFFVPHPPPTHSPLSLRFSRLVMSIYLLSFAVSLNVNLAAPDGASNLTHLMHPSAQRAQRGENKTRKADRTNFSVSIVDVFFRLHPPRGRFPGNTGHASASSEFV